MAPGVDHPTSGHEPRPRTLGPTAVRRRPVHRGPGRPGARERFAALDPYRVAREWQRYEGTPQRELFRELRTRFLRRHPPAPGWVVDLGSGPGRFSEEIGGLPVRTVLVDISDEMLRSARRRRPLEGRGTLIRADALHPPLRPGRITSVVALGNPVGFAGAEADEVLAAAAELLRPGGQLVLEAVSGPGEYSAYLRRLPRGAVRRLLGAPLSLVQGRLLREGFRRLPPRRSEPGEFRRYSPKELAARLAAYGLTVTDVCAVAPCLGADPDRTAAVRADPPAWRHLLELEETVGRLPDRHPPAAALLVRAVRGPGPRPSE